MEDLAAAHLSYTKTISRIFVRRYGMPHLSDEIEGWAVYGLYSAIRSHDPTKGPLTLHIFVVVNRAIVDGLRSWYGRSRKDELEGRILKPEANKYGDFDPIVIDESHEDRIASEDFVRWALGYIRACFDDRTYESLVAPFFGHTKESVARKWGVDPSRISQIRKRAAIKLKNDEVWNAVSEGVL